jgi:hypothetical protein
MHRAFVGWALILCGWSCYLIALACPAVDLAAMELDGFGSETKLGTTCWCDTFNPGLWLFAPLLFFYAVANMLMITSLFLIAASPVSRRKGSWFILFSFGFTLTAPWCAGEAKGILVGCVFWILSFLWVGLGFFLLSCAAQTNETC